jgi:hypothetical protein
MREVSKRYRCRLCGHVLNAWLPAAQEPNGAMLLHHVSVMPPDQVTAYLDRMPTDEDHLRVIVEAYEVVEDAPPWHDQI